MIRAAVAAALVAAVVCVYAGVGDHAFLAYDDDLYVVDDPRLREPLDARALWRAFSAPYDTNWIPLTTLSLQAGHAWHGLDAGAFLWTNVALHSAGSALLFLALLRLSGALWPSAFAAAVFALHPLHVETVAWVVERKGVLSGVFFALALFAYAGSARAVRPRHWAASAAFAAGLCAKQSLVPLPLVLLLLDVWPLRRFSGSHALTLARALREKWLLFALAVAGALVAGWAQGSGGAMRHGDALPLGVRLANAALAVVAYLRDALWPAGLAAFYPHPEDAVSRGGAALAAAALLALTLVLVRLRRRAPWLAVGWLWFLLLLAPTLGLVQVGVQARADRYTYLPLTGLALALAWSADAWSRGAGWRRRACAAAGLALCVALAIASQRQVGVWRDTETLFRHAAAVTEGNFLAEHALGSELLARGDAAGAERHFSEALRLRAHWPDAHFALADAQLAQGRQDEAVRGYERGLRLAPRNARGQLRLARALMLRGETAEALGRARHALALARPAQRAEAAALVAAILMTRGEVAAAEQGYAQALALDPDLAEAHAGRGMALLALGRAEEGHASLERARANGGDSPALQLALGDAARLLGRESEARAHYTAARDGARARGETDLAAAASERLGE